MRRYATAIGVVLLITLAGCGTALTQAETAYLADLQRMGNTTKPEDPDAALKDGHEICDGLAKVKPSERGNVAYYARTHTTMNSLHVSAAQSYLCPELFR